MGKISFDLDALASAAGQLDSAGQHSATASGQLGGVAISGSAFGSVNAGSALVGALQKFGQQHADGAAKIAAAHQTFAGRLRAVAAIGEQSIAQSTAASTAPD